MSKTCTSKLSQVKARYEIEPDGHYFVFGKRRRKYGRRYTKEEFLDIFVPDAEKDETTQWHKRLRRAIKIMKESGLSPGVKDRFENMLQMTY